MDLSTATRIAEARLMFIHMSWREWTLAGFAFILALFVRLILAPYTGHDVNVHIVWLNEMESRGPFFYISSEGWA